MSLRAFLDIGPHSILGRSAKETRKQSGINLNGNVTFYDRGAEKEYRERMKRIAKSIDLGGEDVGE